jgi:hypothetical protein
MRKLFLTALILGVAAAGSLLPGRAEALPISSPTAAHQAINGNIEQVRYVCRRVWTRWGPRRSCWWRPSYYRYGYYYHPYRHYSHRRYYRPYHRYYRYGWRY